MSADYCIFLQAFKSICDLLITFSNVNTALKKLQYVSTADQQAVLNNFVQQYVFSAPEKGE